MSDALPRRSAALVEREAELRLRYARSFACYERAFELIPGAHHLSGRPLVDAETTPMYFAHGAGCRIRDVDGHVYVDYLMAFGAQLLLHPRHLWFLSGAHTFADVDHTLDMCRGALTSTLDLLA